MPLSNFTTRSDELRLHPPHGSEAQYYYLAGPMTGIAQFNFPAFIEAAEKLREEEYNIVSPAELDDPGLREECLASPDGEPIPGTHYMDFLARDVKVVADPDCLGVIALPGWERSRGADIETTVARKLHKPVYVYGTTEQGRPTAVPLDSPKADEVRIVNAQTGAAKGSKGARFDLLPWDQLWTVAELYGAGASKYEARNWEGGFAWSLSFAALHRHLAQFWNGEWEDEESGCPHLASVVFHALALMRFHEAHPGLDDRP